MDARRDPGAPPNLALPFRRSTEPTECPITTRPSPPRAPGPSAFDSNTRRSSARSYRNRRRAGRYAVRSTFPALEIARNRQEPAGLVAVGLLSMVPKSGSFQSRTVLS